KLATLAARTQLVPDRVYAECARKGADRFVKDFGAPFPQAIIECGADAAAYAADLAVIIGVVTAIEPDRFQPRHKIIELGGGLHFRLLHIDIGRIDGVWNGNAVIGIEMRDGRADIAIVEDHRRPACNALRARPAIVLLR